MKNYVITFEDCYGNESEKFYKTFTETEMKNSLKTLSELWDNLKGTLGKNYSRMISKPID